MNTCVSLHCPLINYCKHYNFTVDRGSQCSYQKEIIERVAALQKREKTK